MVAPERMGKSKNSCKKCNKADNSHMVACNVCNGWTHLKCANLTEREAIILDKFLCSEECENEALSKPCTKTARERANVRTERSSSANLTPIEEDLITISPVGECSATITEQNRQIASSTQIQPHHEGSINNGMLEILNQHGHSIALLQATLTEILANQTNVSSQSEAASTSRLYSTRQNTNDQRERLPGTTLNGSEANRTLEQTLSSLVSRLHSPDLPAYYGDMREWPGFKSRYLRMVESEHLTNDEIRCKLMKAVRGEALEAVRDMIYEDDHRQIFHVLESRFGNTRLILNKLTKELLEMQGPTLNNSSSVLAFGQKLASLVSNIKAMRQYDYLRNPMLVGELELKFDQQLRIEWFRKPQYNQNPTLEDLSNFMKEYMEMAVRMPSLKTTNTRPVRQRVNQIGTGHMTTSTLFNDKHCIICQKGPHEVKDCYKFKQASLADRWQLLKEKNLRPCCLKSAKHRTKECPTTKQCNINNCKYFHHRLMHENKTTSKIERTTTQPETYTAPEVITQKSKTQPETYGHISVNNGAIYKIIPVQVEWRGQRCNINAFLDDGASPTLIEESVFNELQMEGSLEPLWLQYANGESEYINDSKVTSLAILSHESNKLNTIDHVHTVKELKVPQQTSRIFDICSSHEHLRSLPCPQTIIEKPRMLIGLQHAKLLASLETRLGQNEDDPIASRTKLGWVIYGSYNDKSKENIYHINAGCTCSQELENLSDLVKGFFTTENIGVTIPKSKLLTQEEKRAEEIVQQTLKIEGDRYRIGLFWKKPNITLPDNYKMAHHRLLCLEYRMKKNDSLANWMSEKVKDLVTKGYARKASEAELNKQWPRTWYIPIFPVVNANKVPIKIRLVWDAAMKGPNGESLNDHLIKGPDGLSPLLGVLFKFREGRFAVSADIKEMFHQILIHEEDQQSQRFLWRDGNTNKKPDVYIMQVMAFGPTCSPAAAQIVKNTNAERFRSTYPTAVDAIINNHYVDDYLNSHNLEEEAINIAKQVVTIHQQAGFELRNFISNSNSILQAMSSTPIKAEVSLSKKDDVEKVLGMHWSTKTDCLVFKLNRERIDKNLFDVNYVPTKRELLRTVMQLYDPMGLLSFYIIRAKVLLQDVWRTGIGWDEQIGPELQKRWWKWFFTLQEIEDVNFPRCYAIKNENTVIDLHTFVDASEEAFGAVSYFRIETDGNVVVTLVAAKSKVAPLKTLSIPRKELQGALIGTRLADAIIQQHRIHIRSKTFWTDSKVVLSWIQSTTKKFQTFVSVRVGEILETTNSSEWRHVPTNMNVADIITKWQREDVKSYMAYWTNGPPFLSEDALTWPTSPNETTKLEQINHIEFTTAQNIEIDISRFFNWRRAVRTYGYVLLYMSRLKIRMDRRSKLNELKGASKNVINESLPILTTEDLARSEILLLKFAQQDFGNEIGKLKSGQTVEKTSILYQLTPKINSDELVV